MRSLPPISQDQFDDWLSNPVTSHLMQCLEDKYKDVSFEALANSSSLEYAAIFAFRNDAKKNAYSEILTWSPTDTYISNSRISELEEIGVYG